MMKNDIVYDRIGTGYNQTRMADPYIVGRLLNLLQCQKGAHCLDIGCGTGNYTLALAAAGLVMTGADPSGHMLDIARLRNPNISWIHCAAEDMELPDGAFAGVTGVLTLHHWRDIAVAFSKLAGVLTPGGRMVFFTATPEQMQTYWLNHYFPQMLADSIAQMPGPGLLETAADKAGLKLVVCEPYAIQSDLQDHFLYTGKDHPHRYLDAGIRRGISSFAALALAEEVAEGLARLKEDIDKGTFADIRSRYSSPQGDYLFVVFEKPLDSN